MKIEIPAKLGDTVYIVENWNPYWDKEIEYHLTPQLDKIKITRDAVEGYIFDKYGLSYAELGHDGWNTMGGSLPEYMDDDEECKIFKSYDSALAFVKKHSI